MDREHDSRGDAEKTTGCNADGRPVEESSNAPRTSARDRLLKVAAPAAIWRTPDGEAYATLTVDGHREHWAVRGRGFKDWLLRAYGAAYPIEIDGELQPGAVNRQALADALDFIEARALAPNAPVHEPSLRSASHEDAIYIDLGTPDWSAIKVASTGWSPVPRGPVPVLRTRRTRPLPTPSKGTKIEKLLDFVPIDAGLLPLVVAWLLAAMWPATLYPILVLVAEHGSGKSTVTRVLRRLVDPAGGDLLPPPSNERDLVATARHNRLLAFDNLSSLPPELADSICRLSTGGEIGGRGLFTDHDLATFAAARPVILNGIPDLATRGDLASRSVVITLEPLPTRMDEAAFRAEFELAAPGIFGALLDGLATAIRSFPSTPTPQGVRMADFAKLAAAAAPAFGWKGDEVVKLLLENAAQQAAKLAEGDLVAAAVTAVLGSSRRWEGTMGGLYEVAKRELDEDGRRSPDWPKQVRYFSDRLRRAAPALRATGIAVSTRSKDGRTLVTLEQKGASATSPTSVSSATCGSAPVEEAEGAESGRSGRATSCSPSSSNTSWEEEL